MQEKTKKWLLSLALRSAVAASAVAFILILDTFVPKSGDVIKGVLTKSTDVQKIAVLLGELLKEALP